MGEHDHDHCEHCNCVQCACEKQVIISNKGAKPVGPYSPGIQVGNLLFVSGQLGLIPETGNLAEGGIEAQTRQVIENIRAVLEGGGSSLEQVVKTTIFLGDIQDFSRFNAVYGEYFPVNPPARSTVQAAALPRGAAIMIEAIALIPCACDCCK